MSDSATLWTVARQAPVSMGFSRQDYWSGLPFPSPGDPPNPGMEPTSLLSPSSAGGFFTASTTWEALLIPKWHCLVHVHPSIYPSTLSSLSIHLLMNTGCFHILAIVNTASMNIEETVPFPISVFVFFLDVYPEVELLGHMVVLFLVILRILHTVFHSGYTDWEFPFFYLLANACYLCYFWRYPSW